MQTVRQNVHSMSKGCTVEFRKLIQEVILERPQNRYRWQLLWKVFRVSSYIYIYTITNLVLPVRCSLRWSRDFASFRIHPVRLVSTYLLACYPLIMTEWFPRASRSRDISGARHLPWPLMTLQEGIWPKNSGFDMDKISTPLGENRVPSSVKAADSSGWSASRYNKTASFVYSTSFIAPVLSLLDAKPGERIFDFGCGSGEVTLQIAEAVGKEGVVVGVDLSQSMVSANFIKVSWDPPPSKIDKAKANGAQHAFVADIQHLLIPEPFSWIKSVKFDAVFSNASLHWCKQNPVGVLESAKGVLKRGGRFVGEMGGFMNCVGKLNRTTYCQKAVIYNCSNVQVSGAHFTQF